MRDYKDLIKDFNSILHFDSSIIAVKRMENKEELDTIEGLEKPREVFTFCMLPHWVRKEGKMLGMTLADFQPTIDEMGIGTRCFRIQGLADATEEQVALERDNIMGGWFNDQEQTAKHMDAYPVPSKIEAMAMAPLEKATFEPDYVLIYADTEQMNYLLNGLQFNDYERYQFHFTGEGSCADALPQAVVTGKPALSIPCLGERMRGYVAKDELVLALPIDKFIDGVEGMKGLSGRGITMLADMPKEIYEQQPKA